MLTFSDEITLIKEKTKGIDEFGNPIKKAEEKKILCNKLNIYSQEFYQAANVGLKPQAKVNIHAMEYSGEEKAIYHDKKFYIIRTFQKDEFLELVLGEKIGK